MRKFADAAAIAALLAMVGLAAWAAPGAELPDVPPPPPMIEDIFPDAVTATGAYRCGDATVVFEIHTSLGGGVSVTSYTWSNQPASERDLAIINRYLAQMKYATRWTVRCVGNGNRLIVDGYDHRKGWLDNQLSVLVWMNRASVIDVTVRTYHYR